MKVFPEQFMYLLKMLIVRFPMPPVLNESRVLNLNQKIVALANKPQPALGGDVIRKMKYRRRGNRIRCLDRPFKPRLRLSQRIVLLNIPPKFPDVILDKIFDNWKLYANSYFIDWRSAVVREVLRSLLHRQPISNHKGRRSLPRSDPGTQE